MSNVTNAARDLAFADGYLSAQLVENVRDFVASGIVVNLSPETIVLDDAIQSPIQPWRSTTVTEKAIKRADRIALLSVANAENLGGVMLRGWKWFGDIYSGFPRETPLFVSPVDSIGDVAEDPMAFTRERHGGDRNQLFEIKLKCWWSPGQTDCFIHNEHPFLEVHTQIHGSGRMQKFAEHDATTLYEDVIMTPGFTHEPFCRVTGENAWTYPHHRYFTDDESIWLAIELHPKAAA